jgi:hypothetical protein
MFLKTLFPKELDHVEVSSMDAACRCVVVERGWLREYRFG